MSMSEKILGLFPTPLYRCNFSEEFEYDRDLVIDKIKDDCITMQNNPSNTTYLSKDGVSILDNPYFLPLKELILREIKYFGSEVLCVPPQVEFNITSSWCNFITDKEGYHHQHIHSNSFLSGIFYLRCIKPKDTVIFASMHPKSIYSNLNFPPVNDILRNTYNSELAHMGVVECDLLIFPSGVPHLVRENEYCEGDNNRLSLSFNVNPHGCYDGNLTTYWEGVNRGFF